MQYFSNTELAKLYHIAPKTAHNWIESAQKGRLDLVLYERDGKTYIANTDANKLLMQELVERNKKHRPASFHKTVTPVPAFYELYDSRQVFDIMSSIKRYGEIPFKYTYFNDGAASWDQYATKLLKQETFNSLTGTIELLKANQGYLDALLTTRRQINVIDLGVGNAMPVKGLLAHLAEKGVLGRYIGLDISKGMIDVAKRNINDWFGSAVTFEAHVRDITEDRFSDLLIDDYFSDDPHSPINLVLLLGGTLSNLREPREALNTIYASMGSNDFFIYTKKLDTENSRQFFDFSAEPQIQPLNRLNQLMLNLLGIDESLYEVEHVYDEKLRARIIRLRLTKPLTIVFDLHGATHSIELHKDEPLLVWRSWHQSADDVTKQLEANGFKTLHASKTVDHEYLLTVSQVKTSRR